MKHYLVLFAFILFFGLVAEAQRLQAKKTMKRRIAITNLARNPGGRQVFFDSLLYMPMFHPILPGSRKTYPA